MSPLLGRLKGERNVTLIVLVHLFCPGIPLGRHLCLHPSTENTWGCIRFLQLMLAFNHYINRHLT